ncbi:hypothetical protein FZI85_08285 [Mycobacterium sp. CBMA293]|uniref:hypothetical protein n=1 Tax=unclassified Mycolicibacterium TaxID=2636767 RepID=UPI0012DD399F|nr:MULTISPECIES: hypothetical protein [unclassified Mycolicibacterium]MUL46405.1 hypothetical protein [Mycolicibacterium sp. CBMA 360]MUL57083.1 hypothetical protein [Mycolicibacterium sp. CBMA 335]MUL70123.1 hypothetical protein [Mycolicibacterium sp. CBMA 311]MUL92171.1 hypothetical protein [Mycolicibacterium sp. CBMA 230]MUM05910.1 hypothetical protein [Mycolicibacterium sp. CBMA 213]
MTTPGGAAETTVFSAAGHPFTWVEVIDAARVRGEWQALQRQVAGLLSREAELSATDALPTPEATKVAGTAWRYRYRLLSADELKEWLTRYGITVPEWMAEMRRSLTDPADGLAQLPADQFDRACWVHAVCSGVLTDFARVLAEEVAVALAEQPDAAPWDHLAALPDIRKRFCSAQLREPVLAAEVHNNRVGWTSLELQMLIHPDEAVTREAAMCVAVDGRELADVAADAGAQLLQQHLLLDDADPALRTRLLAADTGELVGPLSTGSDHCVGMVLKRLAPSLDDPEVRRRAEDTVLHRALATEVNRHVHWHERL